MKKVALMGIDGMEHGSLITEDTARVMEERDIYLVPTFCPYDDIINLNEESLKKKTPQFQQKLRQYSERLKAGRKTIINSKIRLGYGTDFVAVHNAYENGYEYESWLNSGIDPFRALKAATSINAGILGLEDLIGTIEPGKSGGHLRLEAGSSDRSEGAAGLRVRYEGRNGLSNSKGRIREKNRGVSFDLRKGIWHMANEEKKVHRNRCR